MISDRDAELLLTGAWVGHSNIKTYLAFLDGFTGLRSELAEFMGLSEAAVATHVQNLKDKKLIRISGWRLQYAVYALSDGSPDVPRPAPSKRKFERVVATREKKNTEANARIQNFLKTQHGYQETRGAVTVHRMR